MDSGHSPLRLLDASLMPFELAGVRIDEHDLKLVALSYELGCTPIRSLVCECSLSGLSYLLHAGAASHAIR